MKRTGALAAYATWQLRDAVAKALAPLAIFGVIAGIPLAILIKQYTLAGVRDGGRVQSVALQNYQGVLPVVLTLGSIILMSGGASLDRERQHVRFLFSRPVTPWGYYLQQFLLSSALFVAAMALLPLFFSWLVTDVPVLAVVRAAAVYAIVYGSLGLFCGALLNRDGIFFIGAIVLAQTLQAADRAEQLGSFFSAVAKALPPLGSVGQLRMDWFAGRAADSGDLRLAIGYGVGMLAAALWVIHRRPLVR